MDGTSNVRRLAGVLLLISSFVLLLPAVTVDAGSGRFPPVPDTSGKVGSLAPSAYPAQPRALTSNDRSRAVEMLSDRLDAIDGGRHYIQIAASALNTQPEDFESVLIQGEPRGVKFTVKIDPAAMEGPWIVVDTDELIATAATRRRASNRSSAQGNSELSQDPLARYDQIASQRKLTAADFGSHDDLDAFLASTRIRADDYATTTFTRKFDRVDSIDVWVDLETGEVLRLTPHVKPPKVIGEVPNTGPVPPQSN